MIFGALLGSAAFRSKYVSFIFIVFASEDPALGGQAPVSTEMTRSVAFECCV